MYTQLIGGAIFTVVAGGMAFLFTAVAGPMGAVPAIMALFGLGIMVNGLRNVHEYQSATIHSLAAAVVDERVKITGGGKSNSAMTQYFTSIQGEDGVRKEFQVIESVTAKIAPGDMGIAFTKGDYLIEFIVVPV